VPPEVGVPGVVTTGLGVGLDVGTCFTYVYLPLALVRVTSLFKKHIVELVIVKATQDGR